MLYELFGNIVSDLEKQSFVICFVVVFMLMMVVLGGIIAVIEKHDRLEELERAKKRSHARPSKYQY